MAAAATGPASARVCGWGGVEGLGVGCEKRYMFSFSPPNFKSTRWREQSRVGENKPEAPGWMYFYFRCDVESMQDYF